MPRVSGPDLREAFCSPCGHRPRGVWLPRRTESSARSAGVAIDHARRYSSLEARDTELRRTVDALEATVEPEVQRGALRRAIECQ
jgi:hypothetical protein